MPKAPALAALLLLVCPSARGDEPPLTLQAGKPVERGLKGGERHTYALGLEAGQFAKLEVFQRGIDVAVTVFDPQGKKVQEVDSPNGSFGPEPVPLTAEASGVYRIEVAALDAAAKPGRYQAQVKALLSPEETARYRIVELKTALAAVYEGGYDFGSGHVLLLGPFDVLGGQLTFLDLETLRFGVLRPRSETEFFTGPALLEEYPATAEVIFERVPDGSVSGLTWTAKGGRPLTARRLPCRREDVSFKNGDVTLKGKLLLPGGQGPFPAVVLAHGSGDVTRNVAFFPAFFLHLGMAVLSFDKRGCGESTGDWRVSSLDELAGDVLADLALIRSRPEVDARRVGIWGPSQAGWVASLAASRSPDVRFLVLQSGSGVPVYENVVHENEGRMREAGLSEEEVKEAVAFNLKVNAMAADGQPWETIAALYNGVRDRPWAEHVFPAPLPKDSPWWAWFKVNGRVDSAVALRNVRCPVLWFLGEKDWQVPTPRSEKRLREALAANPDHTVRVVAGGSHSFLETEHGYDSEAVQATRYVPGYWDTMTNWLRSHLGLKPR